MFKTLFNKVKKNFRIYTGKTMLIDKEGELWTLNEKEEAVKVSEDGDDKKQTNQISEKK